MSSTLPERLKTETRGLHTQVERSALMGALLRGELSRAAYVAMLRNLEPIYEALEAGLRRHASEPAVEAILDEALFRSDALARDLEALHGAGWRTEVAVLPQAAGYVARLRHLAAEGPADLLVAHAYVRYLGDLSGGQLLKRIVIRSFQPRAGTGIAFYDFGDAAQTAELAAAFRTGLGRAAADGGRLEAIVAEAVAAFERHRLLFDELAQVGDGLPTRQASPVN